MPQRPYLKDRLIEEFPEGFVVIVPREQMTTIPLVCPHCKQALRDRDDECAYMALECCDWCSRTWAAARREAWLAGWRPSIDDVSSARAERSCLTVTFRVD